MFKPIRSIAGIAAVTAVAGVAAVGGAAPESAEAASCRQYAIPSSFTIDHGHGWTVKTRRKIGKFKWEVSAWHNPRRSTVFGTMRLTRFDTTPGPKGERPEVEFTISLNNGSAGYYEGKINRRNFLTGDVDGRVPPRVDGRLLDDGSHRLRLGDPSCGAVLGPRRTTAGRGL